MKNSESIHLSVSADELLIGRAAHRGDLHEDAVFREPNGVYRGRGEVFRLVSLVGANRDAQRAVGTRFEDDRVFERAPVDRPEMPAMDPGEPRP
jgi:hypothetical protein